MASFESLIKDVLPYVPGCPDSLIKNNLRSATIELCEKSKAFSQVWPVGRIWRLSMSNTDFTQKLIRLGDLLRPGIEDLA